MTLRQLKRRKSALSLIAARNADIGFRWYCAMVSRMHVRAARELGFAR